MPDALSRNGNPTIRRNLSLFSFNNVQAYRGPQGTAVLHNSSNDTRIIVQSQVAEALQLCSIFRSIAGHQEAIVAANPQLGDHKSSITRALEQVATAGVFESSAQCWDRLTNDKSPETGSEELLLFVLACDRPAALERLLATLSTQNLPKDCEGIWVIDDSRQRENMEMNGKIIVNAQRKLELQIKHFDQTKRLKLISEIKARLPGDASTIDWLLSGDCWPGLPTFGVARNIALLLSVGKRLLIADDDVICRAVAPPAATAGLRFSSARDREAVFYQNRDDLSAGTLQIDQSPLIAMSRSLGKKLGVLVSECWRSPDALAGMDGALMAGFRGGSSILMTQCGSWGDPGTSNSNWIFHLPQRSIRELLSASTDIATRVGARNCWHGYRGPVISEMGTLSQLTGLDHRKILPPYFPAGRGEDVLFGAMLHRIHPSAAVLNEGWSIQHLPIDTRADRARLSPVASPLNTSLLVDWLGKDGTALRGSTAQQRLRDTADEILRLSEAETSDLDLLIREGLLSRRVNILNRCTYHINQFDQLKNLPGFHAWAEFIELSRDQIVTEIKSSGESLFTKGAPTIADSIDAVQQTGGQFARAMSIWPRICSVVTEIRL